MKKTIFGVIALLTALSLVSVANAVTEEAKLVVVPKEDLALAPEESLSHRPVTGWEVMGGAAAEVDKDAPGK